VLGDVLSEVKTPDQLPSAFEAYDAVRRPKGNKLVETSREAGRIWDLEGIEIGDDAQKFHDNLQTRLDWIFHEDIQGEAGEVKRRFREACTGGTKDRSIQKT
jgi:salicylate hydroxylase